MQRKRFKHQAYIFCHMFCGWQLYSDYQRLARWHNGKLTINILNNKCFVNQEPTEPLSIGTALNNWLLNDLRSNNIPLETIDEAVLEVEFDVARDPRSRRGVTIIDHNFNCLGRVSIGKDSYFCRFRDISGNQEIIEIGHLTSAFTTGSQGLRPARG